MKTSIKKDTNKKPERENPDLALRDTIIGSEELYRHLFETTKDGILIVDADSGRIIDVNPFLLNLLDYPRDSFLGKEIWELDFFKDIASNKEIFNELQQIEFNKFDNQTLEAADGRKISVEFESNVYLLKNTKVIQCNIRDITERKQAEAALIESESRFRTIYENAKIGIYRTTPDGTILLANNALLKMLGYSSFEKLIERNLENDGYEPTYSRKEFLNKIEKDGELDDFESIWVLQDGSSIFVRESARAICDPSGAIIYYDGVVEDITRRKEAENALIISESRLRTLVQTIPDLVWSKDVDGTYLSCNAMFERFFGATEADIVGKTDFDFVDPELASFFRENDQKAMLANKPVINEEWITFANDGHRAFLETIKAPMYDDRNKLIGVLGIGRDITERKNAEDDLKLSEEKFRSYINNAPDGIFVVNETGEYIDANKAACIMSGYNREELLKMSISDILSEEKLEEGLSEFQESLQTGIIKTEILAKRNDGTKRWWYIDGVKVDNNKFLGFTKDITESKLTKEALLKSEEKYRLIVETTAEGIWVVDKDWKTSYLNPAMVEMLGFSESEVLGRSPLEFLISKEDSEASEIMMRREKGVSEKTEVCMRRKNGSVLWTYGTTVPLFDNKGEFTGGFSIVSDITELKHVEGLLRESEERLRVTLEETQIGTFDWDIKNDVFYVSDTYYSMLGYKPRVGAADRIEWLKLAHPDDKELISEKINLVLTGIQSNYSYEARLKHADGEYRWIYVNGHSIKWDENNKPLRLIGVRLDITERKQAEERLLKLSSAVEQTVNSIIITDGNGIIEYVNPAFTEITGFTAEEAVGKTPRILKSGLRDKKYYEELWQTILSGKVYRAEFINKKKNGDLYFEEKTISPIFDKYRIITNFVGTGVDISMRKRNERELIKAKEKAEESDKLKTAFLANMSHEIRTPMNAILGFTGLLKMPLLPSDKLQEYIAVIEKSGARMLNIINDIVNISKIESGLVEIQNIDTNVNDILTEIFNQFKPEAEQKNLQISYKNALTAKESIVCSDRDKIFVVLSNLIKNAIKYTDFGSIAFGYEKKGGNLEFYVKDTGIGIPFVQKEIIFERFRQGSEALNRNFQGAGLGLSISKAYVELLGGKIWVESDLETVLPDASNTSKGSTFYFTIPYFSIKN